jgi:uncharacterized protein YxjI
MDDLLNRNLFLVKEHIAMFKAANNYDIFDPQTGHEIMQCREDKLGGMTKMLRFTDWKRMTPFHVEIRRPDGMTLVSIKRGISFFLSKVDVLDQNDMRIGGFQQKFFSIGGKFDVLDANDAPLCTLRGKWTGWNFKFEKDGSVLAEVSKKWSGIGKEFFTSADNYMLSISESVPRNDPVRPLILAAVTCIDMVLKE